MTEAVMDRPMPTGEVLTFEKVWAIFQEIGEKQKETAKQLQETDKQQKETAKQMQKTEKYLDKIGRQMGGLHNKFGKLAEHLVAPGIAKRFNEMGYHFDSMATRGCKVIEQGKVKAEIDLLLENGETIIAVEVKVNPAIKSIEHHVRRLEILRDHRQKLNFPRKKILGAIAGAIFEDNIKEAVCEAGFFVIEQSGDTMKINVPEGFVPREF